MSGDLRISMLFQADASKARTETLSLRDAQNQLAQGAAAAGKAAATAAPQIGNLGSASRATAQQIIEAVGATGELSTVQQIVRAAINPLVGEYNELQQAMREITLAEDLGAISSREAALAMDGLSRNANEIVAAMEAAGTAIDGTIISISRQDSTIQQLIAMQAGLGRATEETIADQLRHGQVLDELRAKYDPLFAASRQYELELRNIDEAERLGAISAMAAAQARERASVALAPMPGQLQKLGASSQIATLYVTNLGYQINDIGTMMAMGQSPFLLMAQQGPQVVQVFNQMRASGMAIGPAISSAFKMMLNPMSLTTLAVIGVGAAIVQHLGHGTAEVKTLEDSIKDLERATSILGSAMAAAKFDVFDLRKEFGDGALAAREMNVALVELARIEALDKVASAAESLKGKFDGLTEQVARYNEATRAAGGAVRGDWLAIAQTSIRQIHDEFGLTIIQATQVSTALAKMGDTSNVDGIVEGARQLTNVLSQARDESGNIPPKLRETARAAAEAAIEALRLKGYTEEADRIATQFAQNNLAAPIIAANSAAMLLIGNLSSAVAIQNALNRSAAIGGQASGRGDGMAEWRRRQADQQGSGGETLADSGSDLGKRISAVLAPSTGRGSGNGKTEAEKATRSLKELIDAQREQIAVLRETDPVQQEILKNHDALAKATEAEKQTVTDLIAERQRLETIHDAVQQIGQTGEDAFKGMITGAYSFRDALSMVLSKLAEMAASSAWDILWGNGGGSGGFNLGSLLGDWLGGLGGKADGGKIIGAGGPRDDAILTWTSNGEFVTNAAATAANEPLLQAINAGANPSQLLAVLLGSHAPKYADGGKIGASAPSSWREVSGAANRNDGSGSAAGRFRVEFVPTVDKSGNLSALIRSVSREEAGSVMADGLHAYSAEVLPDRIAEINQHPRLRG